MNVYLNNKINIQRSQLEYLIDCSKSLLDEKIIKCSEKMDRLIIKYHKTDDFESQEQCGNGQ